ncbi:MAG: T9SS type A sorting domain-containing protein [Bacteroidales bacterium]|nr:T9SS type A sorting domain-containing protein [Bacteroidales bacterium]
MNKTAFFFLICLIGFAGYAFSQWSFMGLSNLECTEVQVFDNTIYLGTEQGMYMKSVQSTDTLWTPIGLQDRPINDFIVFSQDTILVATQLFVYPEDSISIYITYDGGLNWLPYQNGFGGDYPRCNELNYNPVQTNMLFGCSLAALARSMDKGQSWELIYSDWGMAAMYHIFLIDNNSGEIWMGGQTGYFENKIIKFTDFGDQYEIMNPIPNSTSTCMVKHPEQPDQLMAGGGGGIFVSSNNGLSWEQCEVINGDGGTITDMKLSPQNSKVAYASGFYDEGGSIPLFLKISTDFENSWTTVYYDDLAHDYFVNSLAVFPGSSFDNIYITTNHGVYVYKNTSLSVTSSPDNFKPLISPNPCFNEVNIKANGVISTIRIFDINGKNQGNINICEIAEKNYKLDLSQLPEGIYILHIEQNNQNYYSKLIKK